MIGVAFALAMASLAEADPAARVASTPRPGPPPSASSQRVDAEFDLDPSEPDFSVVDLPTNLRLPRHRMTFRLTHRFSRSLGDGSFSDLAADLFGLDSGAQVGLGLRFGLFSGTRLSIDRTSDRTIEFEAQQELLREGRGPVGASLRVSMEGQDNFAQEYSPSLGLVVSRKLAGRGAVYLVPSWVGNTRTVPSAPIGDENSFVLGLGARLRVGSVMSIVGELHPRIAGYRGDLGSGDPPSLATFGIEARVGGHAFQLNFSNTLGTTPAQVARGAQGHHGWFVGFNLTRKFY